MTRGMMRRGLAFALLLTPLAVPAVAGEIGLPLVYAGCPAGPADPIRIEISEATKGPRVIYQRAGLDPGRFETLDVNLAKISRRLFFTLRTPHGLIEFQGRATDDKLVGLLSDDAGLARTISLAAVRDGALAPCAALQDSHP